ncbi:MAG: hypothetical protein KDA28_17130, partial [Phycisphaerales bacterium]|nr:hypothetical protein [Phycisphaerales bacterium]
PEVVLRRPVDRDWIERYRDEYERVHQERPEIRSVAAAESDESLTGLMDAGGLHLVEVEGDLAGVCAASPMTRLGVSGSTVAEILVFESHRGRRLGPVVLSRLAQVTGGDPWDALHGTIGAANHAALRTASLAGRHDLGGWWWIA